MYQKTNSTRKDLEIHAVAVRHRAREIGEHLTAFNTREEERRMIQARCYPLRYHQLRNFAQETYRLEKQKPRGEGITGKEIEKARTEIEKGESQRMQLVECNRSRDWPSFGPKGCFRGY